MNSSTRASNSIQEWRNQRSLLRFPSMAFSCSFLLLVLLLTPSMKIMILSSNAVFNGFKTLPSFISRVISRGTTCLILSLLRALKLLTDALLRAFQRLAEALKSIIAGVLEMVLGMTVSSVLAVFEFLKSVVFGLFAGSGSTLGGLLEKTKTSFEGSVTEQIRKIIGSLYQTIIDKVLEMVSSSAGSVFDFTKDIIFGLLSEPGPAIGGLLEKIKTSLEGTSMEQIREIIGNLSQTIIDMVFETASSSAGSVFDFIKDTIFGLLSEPGSTMGGLLENVKTSLEGSAAPMESVRKIVRSLAERLLDMVLGTADSSAGGVAEAVGNIFSSAIESGWKVGDLLGKTKTSLVALPVEVLRQIIQNFSKTIFDKLIGLLVK